MADLPPTSSETRLNLPAAPFIIPRPTPGKGDLVEIKVIDQCVGDDAARPGDDVEDARRQARFECEQAALRAEGANLAQFD
ncbi:hypothetical protein TM239_01430 [Bradyrhizobium sp. TM239]|nr:hypothetical protein TM239_01430 [Bradyrhizobium sp. TM239]